MFKETLTKLENLNYSTVTKIVKMNVNILTFIVSTDKTFTCFKFTTKVIYGYAMGTPITT